MDFETIDWEAEAKRVKLAFGFDGVCEFCCPPHTTRERYFLIENTTLLITNTQPLRVRDVNGGHGSAWYGEAQRFFGVARYSHGIGVWLDWKGGLTMARHLHESEPADRRDILILAQTLFHLDLLTPEVEAALQISISQHQKLEWTLEYEARNGL